MDRTKRFARICAIAALHVIASPLAAQTGSGARDHESNELTQRIRDFQDCVLSSAALLSEKTAEPAELVLSASFGRCELFEMSLRRQYLAYAATGAETVNPDQFISNSRIAIREEALAIILSVRAKVDHKVLPKM